MNIIKALKYGAVIWGFMFVAVSIIGFIPFLGSMGANGIEFTLWGHISSIIISVLVSCQVGKWYFGKQRVSFKEGLIAAIPVMLTGILLDVVITVPFFVKSYVLFYSSWSLWTGIVLGAFAFASAGSRKK